MRKIFCLFFLLHSFNLISSESKEKSCCEQIFELFIFSFHPRKSVIKGDDRSLNNYDKQVRLLFFEESFNRDKIKLEEMRTVNLFFEQEFFLRQLLRKEIWHRQLIETINDVQFKLLKNKEKDKKDLCFKLLLNDTERSVD